METMTAKQQINLTKEMKAVFLQVLKNDVITRGEGDTIAYLLEDVGLVRRQVDFSGFTLPDEDGNYPVIEQIEQISLTKELKAMFLQVLMNKVIAKADADIIMKILESVDFGKKIVMFDFMLPDYERRNGAK